MKFIYPEINRIFDTEIYKINTLIIENQTLFCRLLEDIYSQMNGLQGKAILSENNQIIDISKNIELLDRFVPFDINRKPLLTKITNALEKNALSSDLYEQSMQLLSNIEKYLMEISFDFSCDISFPKLSVSALIKCASPELRDEYDSLAEKILDYMELVTVFDRKKLFIIVNLRSYIPDDKMELFAKSAISHGYNILMIESFENQLLSFENRYIVDSELCEIG